MTDRRAKHKEDKMDYQIDHALQAAINRLLLRVVQGGKRPCG